MEKFSEGTKSVSGVESLCGAVSPGGRISPCGAETPSCDRVSDWDSFGLATSEGERRLLADWFS